MSIKSIIKEIILKYPTLINIASPIFNLLMSNSIRIGKLNRMILNRTFLKKVVIKIHGKNNIIEIGDMTLLRNCTVYINGNNNVIKIGAKVSLLSAEFYIEDDNNEIFINDKTSSYGKAHLACIEGCKISIGNDCMFADDITIRTGDSHSIVDTNNQRINPSKDVTIGNHVWLGNKVIITKGVQILDNCIVGTGSVVTKSFDKSGIIIGGNPAKLIKENINWLRERI